MNLELKKRIITSIILISILVSMFLHTYILIIGLIIITIITWIEFYGLVTKIFAIKNIKNSYLRFFFKAFSLIYLTLLAYAIISTKTTNSDLEIIIIYSILISIMTDIGGFIVGKTLGGKKLSKISPKKTISGSVGSFIFSILLVPLFIENMENYSLLGLIFLTILISSVSQMGDLFISILKRKADVKDTSNLLPGHGGVLDRIDGMIFAIPCGIMLFKIFN
jgi:phosphatidate cytidylyltransferase|tara:strand:+ start:1691 stop:2356 length:666 start_codon:yes stop_codon:yes gene_type:complete